MTMDDVAVVGRVEVMVVNSELPVLMLSSKSGKSKSTFQPTCIIKYFVNIKVVSVRRTLQTADCRPGVKCRLQSRGKMQTVDF